MIFHGKNRGDFLKTVISRDFFPEHKNREKQGNFTKSVIYHDQKSEKIPKDWHNERAVVRILIKNGAEISDNSTLAWFCVTGIFLDGCLSLLALVCEPCFQHETCIFF